MILQSFPLITVCIYIEQQMLELVDANEPVRAIRHERTTPTAHHPNHSYDELLGRAAFLFQSGRPRFAVPPFIKKGGPVLPSPQGSRNCLVSVPALVYVLSMDMCWSFFTFCSTPCAPAHSLTARVLAECCRRAAVRQLFDVPKR